MRTILITGASSGIGWACAEALAEDFHLILCGRRKEKLEALKEQLKSKNNIYIYTFDVRNLNELNAAFEQIKMDSLPIDILINNAGNAHGLAPFQDGDLSDFDAMIDSNLKGLIYTSKAALPFLLQSENAHIVNISSIAGKENYANGNVYCASKAGVDALSQGMRIDLVPKGIKVTNIAPGAVETEFSVVRFKGDLEKANKVYQGFQALVAQDVADAIAYCVRAPYHVQIADLTIFPKAQFSATGIVKS